MQQHLRMSRNHLPRFARCWRENCPDQLVGPTSGRILLLTAIRSSNSVTRWSIPRSSSMAPTYCSRTASTFRPCLHRQLSDCQHNECNVPFLGVRNRFGTHFLFLLDGLGSSLGDDTLRESIANLLGPLLSSSACSLPYTRKQLTTTLSLALSYSASAAARSFSTLACCFFQCPRWPLFVALAWVRMCSRS
jgi:hypothetical protein